jgi:hypothetical protein
MNSALFRMKRLMLSIFPVAAILIILAAVHPAYRQGAATPQVRPIFILGSALTIGFDTADKMCRTSLVADVTVDRPGQGHWNTPNGSRPPRTDTGTIMRKGYAILTPVRFARMTKLVRHQSGPPKEIVTLGGIAGADQYWIHGFAQVRPHSRYLVVLVPTYDLGVHRLTDKVLGIAEAFPIDSAGVVHIQEPTIENGQAIAAITTPLTELTKQLAACA